MRLSANRIARGALVLGVAATLKIALANFLLASGLIAWLISRGDKGEKSRRITPTPLLPAIVLYALASLASAVFSTDPAFSVKELPELASLALVPMTLAVLDLKLWRQVLVALTVVGVASALVGIWQYLHGADNLENRLKGLANHYMTFSGWTAMVVLLLLSEAVLGRAKLRLLWTLPAAGLMSLAVVLSLTRNAWVGLMVGCVLLAVIWRPKVLFIAPLVIAAAALLLPREVLDRAASIFDPYQHSNRDRLCMMVAGSRMFRDHPLVGVGLGMVKRLYPLYRVPDAPRWKVPHLHNNPMQLAAERGIFGLSAYFAVLASFFVGVWPLVERTAGDARAVCVGSLVAVAAITTAGLFEYNWGDAEVWLLTLFLMAAPFAVCAGSEADGA